MTYGMTGSKSGHGLWPLLRL